MREHHISLIGNIHRLEFVKCVLYGCTRPIGPRPFLEVASVKVLSLTLVFALVAGPALAQEPTSSIRASAARIAAAAAAEQDSHGGRRLWLWSGVAIGSAGIVTTVLASTLFRIEDHSTGNAPANTYRACVAQKIDPIYAGNQCDALKAKNVKLLAGGVALGAVGAVLMVRGAHTSAELSPGVVRFVHRIRF
jgi:hypothetical protein